MKRVKVFISYAISSDGHTGWVRGLAEDLRAQGIDAKFDQFEVGYGDDFMSFMLDGIADSHFFLFVSTDESRRVADRETENAEERGLWVELRAARVRVEKEGIEFKEFCVLLEGNSPPKHFAGKRYVDCRDPAQYQVRLHEIAMEVKFGRPKPQLPVHDVAWRVGQITVPDIVPEFSFVGDRALSVDQIRSVHEDVSTELSPALLPARAAHIDQKRKESVGRFTFDNNASYDLRGVSIERPQGADGGRRNSYTLHTRPSDYYHFVFPNLVLDVPVMVGGAFATPRDVLGLQRERLRLDSLADFACSFSIGTGTVLVTSDDKVVVSVRSRRQFIVGGAKYHLSAAEGALRPADEVNGEYSPFWTSARSLEDELGLARGVDFRVEDLRCLGVLLDTLRAQPVCQFYVKSRTVTARETLQKWQTRSVDKHENNNLIFMDWNANAAKILLGGRLDVDGGQVEIASNHAQAGFLLAALHAFGEGALG